MGVKSSTFCGMKNIMNHLDQLKMNIRNKTTFKQKGKKKENTQYNNGTPSWSKHGFPFV